MLADVDHIKFAFVSRKDMSMNDKHVVLATHTIRTQNWAKQLNDELPKTVIWSPTMGFSTVDKEILSTCEKAINTLADAGVEIIEKEVVWNENPMNAWMVFWASSCARRHQHLIGTDDYEKIDPQLRWFIEKGTRIDGCLLYTSPSPRDRG